MNKYYIKTMHEVPVHKNIEAEHLDIYDNGQIVFTDADNKIIAICPKDTYVEILK